MNKKTILIIDEKEISDTIVSILEDEGYRAIAVRTGKEAFDILARETVDLVMMEYWLPEEDGMEIFEQIKKQMPKLPVIIISGNISIETAVTAIKKGAADVLGKPLSIDKILIPVSEILGQG